MNMINAKQFPLLPSPKALLQETKHLSAPPQRRILRTTSSTRSIAQDELDKAKAAFNEYRSTRRRDAIYTYLSEVFAVVRRWKEQNCLKSKTHKALRAMGNRNAIRKHDPFATVIFCTSDSRFVDIKTRSKWSRALRVVDEQLNPKVGSLTSFIKSRGGINNVLLDSDGVEERL
jgi:hypothetical protein